MVPGFHPVRCNPGIVRICVFEVTSSEFQGDIYDMVKEKKEDASPKT